MTHYSHQDGHGSLLTLYVKAGFDNRKYGACPFCQRIFMMLMLKVSQGAPLNFRVATVPSSKLPEEFKSNGLRNLPAIIQGARVAIDTVEEIADWVDNNFPTSPIMENNNRPVNEAVDKLARNFFSKFCFYIKSVSRDSMALRHELQKLDDHLKTLTTPYLFGQELTRLDCEVLPKLHHLRVAGRHLKRFEMPSTFSGIWKYLNNAYNNKIFQTTCPPDQEIVLHWASRPDTPTLSYEDYANLTRKTSRFSFDVPAVAIPITLN